MRCPKCARTFHGINVCPICRVDLLTDPEYQSMRHSRATYGLGGRIMAFIRKLVRTAFELTLIYWLLYGAVYAVVSFANFVMLHMEYNRFLSFGSLEVTWVRHGAFLVILVIYLVKRGRQD